MSTVEALQTTLDGEHAAVWVLGLLGARASADQQRTLHGAVTAAYVIHRARRDHLAARVRSLGESPAVPETAYDAPGGVDTPEGIRGAALALEQACATAYAHLVANTTGQDRSWAIDALKDAAARGLVFRGTPENFPGIDELAGH